MASSRSLYEVIFVAHFSAAQPLTVLDMADWYNGVANRYPVFLQQPPWPTFNWYDFEASVPETPLVSPNSRSYDYVPRIVALSEDQRWSVNCQSDRVAVSWRRLEPTGQLTPYPGFENVLDEVLSVFEEFQKWWHARFGVDVTFRICELNYFNAFPFKSGERLLRVSEVFKAWVFRPGKMIANLNVSWIVPPESSKHAQVQCVAAMGATADCPSAAIFNFASSIRLGHRGSTGQLRPAYEALHDAVTDAHIATVNTETIGAQE
ncbi:hypothetical protein ACOSOMT5_P0839 [Acidiphilium sp. MT5]